jgi:hypothetical protein
MKCVVSSHSKHPPMRTPPLLTEFVQRAELPHQQGDLIVRDALILLTNMSTSNKNLTSKRSIMVWTTLSRQLMRF